MLLKTLDHKGRWRNKTVAFRMSPEEAAQLDIYAKLSGLTKQDYMIRRVLDGGLWWHCSNLSHCFV